MVEAQFKAVARALREATAIDPRAPARCRAPRACCDERASERCWARYGVLLIGWAGSWSAAAWSSATAGRRPKRRVAGHRGCSPCWPPPPGCSGCSRGGLNERDAVVVLDYGSGNLRSAERALARAGADVTVTADLTAAAAADGLVVPGVGAYAACMAGIEALGAGPVIADRVAAGRPVLGICVGHADPVRVRRGARRGDQGAGAAARRGDPAARHRVPHMGWNTVGAAGGLGAVRRDAAPDARFYFVHSYAVRDPAGLARPAPGDHRRTTGRRSSPRSSGAAVGGPVPPGEVRRRRRRAAAQLAGHAVRRWSSGGAGARSRVRGEQGAGPPPGRARGREAGAGAPAARVARRQRRRAVVRRLTPRRAGGRPGGSGPAQPGRSGSPSCWRCRRGAGAHLVRSSTTWRCAMALIVLLLLVLPAIVVIALDRRT